VGIAPGRKIASMKSARPNGARETGLRSPRATFAPARWGGMVILASEIRGRCPGAALGWCACRPLACGRSFRLRLHARCVRCVDAGATVAASATS